MNRLTVINQLIQERKYTTYLELGVAYKDIFNHVIVNHKECVDVNPAFNPTYVATTDTFFELNTKTYDLIFIDANHNEEFVARDIQNSLRILNPNGCIVCHDVNPPNERFESERICGTAWKAFAKFRYSTQFFTYTYADDYGVGVIDTSKKTDVIHKMDLPDILTYIYLIQHRNTLLGLV